MSIIKRVLRLCVLLSYFVLAETVLEEHVPTIKNGSSKIHFTQEEQAYLAEKKEITVCDAAKWMPYVGHDEDQTFGIIVDHYKFFSSRIGVPMRFVRDEGLEACVKKVLAGEADVVSSIGSPNTFVGLTPSDEYGQDFVALVTQLNTPFISDITALEGKVVGVFGQYKNLIAYLGKIYPSLELEKTDSSQDGLNKVARGEWFAFIDVYRVAAYAITREYVGELKINTKVYPLTLRAHVGVHKDNILLQSIFNKAIADLSAEEKTRMIDHWMRAKSVAKPNYVLLGQIIAISLLIILGLLYYHLKERHRQKLLLAQQAKLAGMGTMINNIAHQWRQPLARINSNITVLNSILDSDTDNHKILKTKIANIEDNTQYMSDTIEDFITFFHPDKKQTQFILQDTVAKALSLIESRTKDISISIVSDKDVWINSFEKEYKQVILIILNNAIDNFKSRSTEDPKIDINIKAFNGRVTLSIYDNGGGVKEKDRNRIFEPYYTTKFKSEGTGLGLYVAKMLIENSMGGYLRVKNSNDGAYFEIEVDQGDINV